jgi:hypothetical protein
MAKTSEKIYEMVLRVGASSLSTVIDVLANTGEVVSMRQIPVEAVTSEPAKDRRSGNNYNDAARKTGKTGPQVVFEALKPGTQHMIPALGKVLEASKFSPTSVHPAVSVLVAAGLVERHARSMCRLTEAGVVAKVNSTPWDHLPIPKKHKDV